MLDPIDKGHLNSGRDPGRSFPILVTRVYKTVPIPSQREASGRQFQSPIKSAYNNLFSFDAYRCAQLVRKNAIFFDSFKFFEMRQHCIRADQCEVRAKTRALAEFKSIVNIGREIGTL